MAASLEVASDERFSKYMYLLSKILVGRYVKTVNFSKNGWLIKHKKHELLCLGIFYKKISSFILS